VIVFSFEGEQMYDVLNTSA